MDERRVLIEREHSEEEHRFLDLLRHGLSREFPNPERTGCPGSAVLKGIALGKLRLGEVDQWLDHLGSCSPCFQEFTEFRRQRASQRRRMQAWVAVAAVLVFAVAGWLWVETRPSVKATDTAVLDLRERSVARGRNPSETGQSPLEIPRTAKHLILDLPIGSKEGRYDVTLLSDTGDEILRAAATAQLEDHAVILRADVDLTRVESASYFIGYRQAGLEWTRFPIRVH